LKRNAATRDHRDKHKHTSPPPPARGLTASAHRSIALQVAPKQSQTGKDTRANQGRRSAGGKKNARANLHRADEKRASAQGRRLLMRRKK
jgi:hypothetical protein